jgi:putative glutamine amidotransferase
MIIGVTAHPATVGDTGEPLQHFVATMPYVKAVHRAGATPVILPIVDPDDLGGLLDAVDAVVITGGGDVDPARYGATEVHEQTYGIVEQRDEADLALVHAVIEHGTPTLAICRGIQVVNVALGGTLHQHLDDHMRRDLYNDDVHKVSIEPDSRLATIVDTTELTTNSLHHQHVDRLGEGVRVVATAPDGTVEAIEVDHAPNLLAVQWHPELLRHREEHLALFRQLTSEV